MDRAGLSETLRCNPARSRRRWLASLALGFVMACGADDPNPGEASEGRPGVVVSIAPLAFFVEKLAGDAVDVGVMLPPAANPTTFEPTLQSLRAMEDAVLYVAVGHPDLPFESAWLAPLLAHRPELPVVEAAEGLAVDRHDPHVWLAPVNARRIARNIRAGLAGIDSGEPRRLDANLARLLTEIDELDTELRHTLRGTAGRPFLVFHPAWGHFAASFDLRQLAIEEHGKAPDPRRLARLVADAKRDGIRTVFVQPQFDPASAQLVASELRARVEVLDPMARDWDANLRRSADRLSRGLAETRDGVARAPGNVTP